MASAGSLTIIAAFAICVLFFTLPGYEAQELPSPAKSERAEILAAIEQIGSKDFKIREAATQKVWEMGRAAEPLLREAITKGDAEMRYRGSKILAEFELGIYPDTPLNIVKLVNQYRKGSGAAREMAIIELAQLGKTKLLVKLVKRERNPNIRKTVAQIVARNVAEEAPSHIFKGNLNQARDLLEVAALDQLGMRNYVAFLLQTDQIQSAIEHQRKLSENTQVDAEILAWMLRANGNFAESAQIFNDLNDKTRSRHTLAASGNLTEYAKSFVDPSRRTTDTLGFAAAAARLSGNKEEFKRITKDIEEYAIAIKDELGRCINALVLNGDTSRAFQLSKKANAIELFDMEMWRYNFDAAFQAIGIKSEKAPYDKWLNDYEKNFKVENEEAVQRALGPAVQLATACSLTGQDEEAERIMRTVEKLLLTNNASLLQLIRWERIIGLDELAREHAIKALKVESKENVIDAFFQLRAEHSWLTNTCWDFLSREFPNENTEKALQRMSALFDFDQHETIQSEALQIIKAMASVAADVENQGQRKELTRAVKDLARLHENWDLAAKATGEWIQLIGEEAVGYHFMRYGDTLLNANKPKLAAEQYERAWQTKKSEPLPLYLKGVALSQEGEKEEAAKLKKKASLMATGDVTKRHFLANSMWKHGDTNLAREQDRIILRLASPHESVHPEALRRKYADTITLPGKTRAAAKALEFYMLSKMRAVNAKSVISPRNALSYQINLGVLQAKVSLKDGDADAAIAKIKYLQAINPSDSSMLEDIYQLLLDAGKKDKANEIFETTYVVSKATVGRFPNHGQHNNNHAWLLSRCAKKLDEALKYANKAVELEPKNGAFLDTLAEVYFQLGNRSKAVEISERAVEILDGDAQVKRQLERFKNGKTTDR